MQVGGVAGQHAPAPAQTRFGQRLTGEWQSPAEHEGSADVAFDTGFDIERLQELACAFGSCVSGVGIGLLDMDVPADVQQAFALGEQAVFDFVQGLRARLHFGGVESMGRAGVEQGPCLELQQGRVCRPDTDAGNQHELGALHAHRIEQAGADRARLPHHGDDAVVAGFSLGHRDKAFRDDLPDLSGGGNGLADFMMPGHRQGNATLRQRAAWPLGEQDANDPVDEFGATKGLGIPAGGMEHGLQIPGTLDQRFCR